MNTAADSILKKLLLLSLVVVSLYYAKEFLMPLSIGAVLATFFLPFCNWMERVRVPKIFAVFICVLALLLAVGGVVTLLGWQISELTADFSVLKQRSIHTFDRVQTYIYDQLGVKAERQRQMIKDQQSTVIGILPTVAGSFASVISTCALVLVYLFGLLYYRTHIKLFLIKLSPKGSQAEMEKVLYSAARVSQQYLVGLTKMIMILWIMYAIGFSVLGVKNAVFFAVLCGALEIIPFIGNITGTTITVLVAAVQGASLPLLGGIVITYAIVQLIQGWILEPLIVGSQVKINPLFTIIALILGELVWGLPGIFLAIPLIAIFKIVCDQIEPLKPYGFLVGEIATEKKELWIVKKVRMIFKKR